MSSLQTPPLSAGQGAPESSAVRLVRILLPVIVLAAGVAIWELVVRVNEIPPYVLPGPGAVFETLVKDWPVLSQSLMVTLLTTLEGFVAAAFGGVALALLFNQSKWLEYSLFPYCGDPAGHTGHCDRAAVIDLSSAADRRRRLRLDRRLLSGAVQHDARAEFRGSQSGRPVSALRRLADADAALSQIAFRVAVHPWRIADSGRPVVDRRRGRRNRGGIRRGGLRISLPNRGIRLPSQHCQNVRRVTVALRRRDCHLCAAGANLASGAAALA